MRAKGMTAGKLAVFLLLFIMSLVFLYTFLGNWNNEKATSLSENGGALPEKPLPKRVRHKAIELVGKEFVVLGKPTRILSGAVHYFRVVPDYWRDRLLKLKAMGLNTVET